MVLALACRATVNIAGLQASSSSKTVSTGSACLVGSLQPAAHTWPVVTPTMPMYSLSYKPVCPAHLVDLGAVSTTVPRSIGQATAHVAFQHAHV